MLDVKLMEVIRIKLKCGEGTDKCPMRTVVLYYSFTGVLLSKYDPNPCEHQHYSHESGDES